MTSKSGMGGSHALGHDAGDLIRVVPRVRARVSVPTAQRVLAGAIVPMVAVTVWLALTSDHLARPLGAAL